ncbi:hypothetical protein SCYAM73S_04997 [Streptomyces cyaneofuscatus]
MSSVVRSRAIRGIREAPNSAMRSSWVAYCARAWTVEPPEVKDAAASGEVARAISEMSNESGVRSCSASRVVPWSNHSWQSSCRMTCSVW